MNTIFSLSSFLCFPLPLRQHAPCVHLQSHYTSCYHRCRNGHRRSPSFQSLFFTVHPSRNCQPTISAMIPSDEGAISVINFEDFMEKDWSFLDSDDTNTDGEWVQKSDRIISSGKIGETSKVLISIGSERFVDRVVQTSPCEQLLIVHDSLFTLACIKEKYDRVKCWQGELIYVPEKWAPFDVVFLYFLPALPFKLGLVLGALAKHCLPGARIVISHPTGREVLEQQRKQYPDVVVSDLPDKTVLENVAADHSFKVIEFVDEPGFYLVVLKLKAKELFK